MRTGIVALRPSYVTLVIADGMPLLPLDSGKQSTWLLVWENCSTQVP